MFLGSNGAILHTMRIQIGIHCLALLTAIFLSVATVFSGFTSPEQKNVTLDKASTTDSTLAKTTQSDKKPWLLVITPIAGYIHNTFYFAYEVEMNELGVVRGTKTFQDGSFGFGLSLIFQIQSFSVQNTFFIVPDLNQSTIVGDMLAVRYGISIHDSFDLVPGLDVTYYNIATHFQPFQDTITKLGITVSGRYEDLYARHNMIYLYPKFGLRIHLPIQQWTVTPFVGASYSLTRQKIHSGSGIASYSQDTGLPNTLPPIQMDEWSAVYPSYAGVDLSLDYKRFLQAQIRFYYYAIINKIDVQVYLTTMFHRHIGITGFFEYSQGITNDNIFLFGGPVIAF